IQSSGTYNALGLVKFDFANTESVYLHDTNNKSAFKKRKRALSHGCVRVQNPFDLAAILYEMNEFDEQKIEELGIIVGNPPTTEEGEEFLKNMEEREEKYYENLSDEKKHFYRKLRPTSVRLENPMPLYIEYYTCFVGDNGCIQYRDDVYYKDENINYLIKNQ
ncbi:MAG: L,D-transpeptidase family protein, partial [Bacteroidales bacterium]|nr:L,D-transpeptidase family protein [Bacteroidales bacterium]